MLINLIERRNFWVGLFLLLVSDDKLFIVLMRLRSTSINLLGLGSAFSSSVSLLFFLNQICVYLTVMP